MEPHTVRLPKEELGRLDDLVAESDHFDNRAQAIRYAIRVLIHQQARPDTTGFRVQSDPVNKAQARTIEDKLNELLGVKHAGWDVVPVPEVQDE